jgi:hypothetical protein
MEFRVKKKGESKKESVEKRGEPDKASSKDDSLQKGEHETESMDPEMESKTGAGQDMLDAIASGDPHKVFKAHRHLVHVHSTTGPDLDPKGDGDSALSSKVDLVSQVKGMSPKKV